MVDDWLVVMNYLIKLETKIEIKFFLFKTLFIFQR